MAQPDLRYYFSTQKIVNNIAYNTDIATCVVFNTPVYAERELINIIGNFGNNLLLFHEKGSNVITSKVATISLAFEFGSFVAQSSVPNITSSSTSNPELKPNSIAVNTITSGNGDFLGAQGYTASITDETSVVEVVVYLTNKDKNK